MNNPLFSDRTVMKERDSIIINIGDYYDITYKVLLLH